ncbi:MAG: hypothetical protein FJ134_05480 [Deltaproteobacteria bacterium]|nr:hypothetical protein [Deltaproteobacteria bacterium]
MIRISFLILLFSFSSAALICGEVIVANEIESFMYADGEMKRSTGNFEITYSYEGDKIIRKKILNIKTNELITDNTIYHIKRNMVSDPQTGFNPFGRRAIRAIGNPGTDSIEILTIFPEKGALYIQSVRSTMDYFIISRSKIVK